MFPPAPSYPNNKSPAASDAFAKLIDEAVGDAGGDGSSFDAFIAAGDTRHAWLVSDLMRFAASQKFNLLLLRGFEELTDVKPADLPGIDQSQWKAITDALIAWDLPAPPDYVALKARLFTAIEPAWAPFFADTEATTDFRHLTWGGVFIDDRPLGDPNPCGGRGCIPALDDPKLVSAAEGDYYPDDAIVFGIVENGEAVAFPKNIMEVHEMTNMSIGGRRFGIPYCTLCGAAQAYYTDAPALPAGVETPILRTSGLLQRSNKFMYDLVTKSSFDTFTGVANAGPLRAKGVVLEQTSVARMPWRDWKARYPETKIVARDGGIGRQYPLDPLRGRDDDGPIFPIGDPDPRLPVQEPVLGVIDGDRRIALPIEGLSRALLNAESIEVLGLTVARDGGGYRVTRDGQAVPTHYAFWFAWSQFYPDSILWEL